MTNIDRGEPANVSKDWLREARTLLETKQACRALVAYAAAVGVEAMPQRKKEEKVVAASAEHYEVYNSRED